MTGCQRDSLLSFNSCFHSFEVELSELVMISLDSSSEVVIVRPWEISAEFVVLR